MEDTKNIKIFFSVIGVLVVGLIVAVVLRTSEVPVGPGKLDDFTTCLKDKGAVFYGAYWCVHCQSTKKLFGSSAKLLPYVECSTADGSAQVKVCTDKKIESYPTWEFLDGSRLKGEVTLQQLAEKTACVLPQ